MRKIRTKQENARSQKIKQFVVGGILILIMILSTLGFAFQGNEKEAKINYNGFEFIQKNQFWKLEIENFIFLFKNNPRQIQGIDSSVNDLTNYYGEPLYIYSEDRDSELEIYLNLNPRENKIIQRIQPACLDPNINISSKECDETLPVKNCEVNFIIIKESDNPKITQDQNCVIIQGPKENLTQITDEFLFKILGIV